MTSAHNKVKQEDTMASQRPGGSRGSSSALKHDLLDLANHLRQEKLYVQQEKAQLQDLNEKVKVTAEKLSHTAWMAHQQRMNVDTLIFSARGSSSEIQACLKANLLDQTAFQDAYKHLSHQEMLYAELLSTIRKKPKLLATFLALGDKIGYDQMSDVVSTVFSGLYGSCMLPEDERLILRLLYHLMRFQLSTSSNPRKLLRQGNCAFTRLYKSVSEELFSAKLFLTSALHEAILDLLCDDEVFLDIDPSKTVVRFTASERLKKFGKEGSPDYAKKVKQHRSVICSKLEALTNKFIAGIRQNLHCFPPSLTRLLRAMYGMLTARGGLEPRTVNAMCVDVLFSLFICPAIVDPHPAGIIETPISYVARSNLMQVAQILQVLALWKWEEIDPRLMDLYSRFDKDALSHVIENMLDQAADPFMPSGPPPGAGAGTAGGSSITSEDDIDLDLAYLDEAIVDPGVHNGTSSSSIGASSHSTKLTRLAILLTREELDQLISFLRSLQGHADLSAVDLVELASLLEPLPDKLPAQHANSNRSSNFKHSTPLAGNNSKSGSDESGAAATSAISTMMAKKHMLSSKLSTALTAKRSSSTTSTPSTPGSDDMPSGAPDATSGPSPVHSHNNGGIAAANSNGTADLATDDAALFQQCEPYTVMVVPLPDRNDGEPPGFLSEDHVVSRSRQASRVVRMNLANLPGADDEDVEDDIDGDRGAGRRNSHGNNTVNSEENSSLVSVGPTGEKRTRFSLSHDDGSIGNTSDNLEAISEAASNHSVASSLEDEPVDPDAEDPINDNLSDMVSANVSGRGTPNVSGRDTPSSQVTEDGGDEGGPSDGQNNRNRSNDAVPPSNSRDQPVQPGADRLDGQGPNRDPVRQGSNRQGDGGGGAVDIVVPGGPASEPGRKSGEPDLEEKFGRFEIKPPRQGHPGSIGRMEQETMSMVSDTWSTDVLASDTETLGESDSTIADRVHRRAARVRLPDELAPMALGVGGDRQLNVMQPSALASSSVGGGGASSSVASSSAANLLDVAETASEAWSMDVLASDTESLRLAELDNEDNASVARSDDTRFTDDTTRSDPEPLLLETGSAGGGHASLPFTPGQGAIRGAIRGMKDEELRRGDPVGMGSNHLRPSRAAAVEQWARQSSGHAPRLPVGSNSVQRRGSDSSGGKPNPIEGSILKKPALGGLPQGNNDSTQSSQSVNANASSGSSGVPPLTSHPSAASIASSTESSAGESASGQQNFPAKIGHNKPEGGGSVDSGSGVGGSSSVEIDGEVEVVVEGRRVAAAAPALSSSSSVGPIAGNKTEDEQVKKPNASTGAIPKSISFDKAVVIKHGGGQSGGSKQQLHSRDETSPMSSSSDMFSNESCDRSKARDKSFFKSWKLPKLGRHRGGHHNMGTGKLKEDYLSSLQDEQLQLPDDGILIPTNRLSGSAMGNSGEADDQSADDILAKYRTKSTKTPSTEAELSNSNEVILASGLSNNRGGRRAAGDEPDNQTVDEFDDRMIIDPNNVEASYAFQDAKRKLRLMLSEVDLSLLTPALTTMIAPNPSSSPERTNELVSILRVQLAEAHNLQDRNMIAQLHETLRCVSLFDNDGCRRLVRSLREDFRRRSPYVSYLVRCRQGLLATLAHQKKLLSRMDADRILCSSHQVNVCIRLFLERREKQLGNFVANFRDSCQASDEKIALMERFLATLWSQLEGETSLVLLSSTPGQLERCRVAVERSVVSHIYLHAMYPNGDADISRDLVLSEHIGRLSQEITPNHRDLRIGRQYHYEAPWPSAQAELRILAAYKTPKDKVACVVRCSQTIMNLLSLSARNSVPAADDFVPVLVYVILKANPPSLLSTVQYVDSFYGNRLSGEDQYWWMQFVAAVEFIKTMDYAAANTNTTTEERGENGHGEK